MLPRRHLAVAAALALTGCQAGGTEGVEEQARSVASAFIEDCARTDIVPAVELLTEPVRAAFVDADSGLEGCLRVLGLAPAGAELSEAEAVDRLSHARVVGVKETAAEQFITVEVEGPDGARSELDLEQRGDLWRIATMP